MTVMVLLYVGNNIFNHEMFSKRFGEMQAINRDYQIAPLALNLLHASYTSEKSVYGKQLNNLQ